MNCCNTCNWYALREGEWGLCVWHTGIRNTDLVQIRTGARKPLYVRADFGCVRWEVDEREPTAATGNTKGITNDDQDTQEPNCRHANL